MSGPAAATALPTAGGAVTPGAVIKRGVVLQTEEDRRGMHINATRSAEIADAEGGVPRRPAAGAGILADCCPATGIGGGQLHLSHTMLVLTTAALGAVGGTGILVMLLAVGLYASRWPIATLVVAVPITVVIMLYARPPEAAQDSSTLYTVAAIDDEEDEELAKRRRRRNVCIYVAAAIVATNYGLLAVLAAIGAAEARRAAAAPPPPHHSVFSGGAAPAAEAAGVHVEPAAAALSILGATAFYVSLFIYSRFFHDRVAAAEAAAADDLAFLRHS